tara:strand:- start:185 stop:730 length:546 start_codon:yes stop_codon:yes gene_type:complete
MSKTKSTKTSKTSTKKTTKSKSKKTTTTASLVEIGSVVQVHYRGTYLDGEQFDSSYDRHQPLTIKVGAGQVLPGFDTALVGMEVGQSKHVSLPKEEAYGDRNPNAYAAIPIGNFPENFTKQIEKGTTIPLTDPEGNNILGTVETINEESIIFDMNHPMAGKDLEFDIEVVGFAEGDGSDLL